MLKYQFFAILSVLFVINSNVLYVGEGNNFSMVLSTVVGLWCGFMAGFNYRREHNNTDKP